MEQNKAPWRSALVRYFEEGCKKEASSVGVELEQFIVDSDTHFAAPYAGENGVRKVTEKLMQLYPENEPIIDEDLLGFLTKDFSITLEPASQLEISIFPMKTVECLGNIFLEYEENLKKVLSPMNLTAMPVATQPESHVDDLVMIPKERYRLMDMHFQKTGTGGREMMRGSCSSQVSVDYTSEEDFRLKVQAATYFAPVLMLLTDHANRFQGEELTGYLKRSDIWERTDLIRTSILPNVFSPTYGFQDYADFLGNIPLIFRMTETGYEYTGFQTVAELYAEKEPTEEEILHILSMAFPHIRLKHYLEVRMADSIPAPFLMGYCSLVKGLLYNDEVLSLVQDRIQSENITEQIVKDAIIGLRTAGWNGTVYSRPIKEAAREALSLAEAVLDEKEKEYLKSLNDVITYEGIFHVPSDQA